MIIEISYCEENDDFPEHYAYCDSIEEAHNILRELEEELAQTEIDKN